MHRIRRPAAIAVAAVCALAGAEAGISSSAAATKAGVKRHSTQVGAPTGGLGGPGGPGGPGGGGMAVHSVEVVLDKAGTAFITQTRDDGTITAVDPTGGTVTIKEGTGTVTYATPTISIASGATVLLDGKTSSLEKLASGDHVSVTSSSDGTTVFATDSSFTPTGHGPAGAGGPPPGGQGSWG